MTLLHQGMASFNLLAVILRGSEKLHPHSNRSGIIKLNITIDVCSYVCIDNCFITIDVCSDVCIENCLAKRVTDGKKRLFENSHKTSEKNVKLSEKSTYFEFDLFL